ncbi:MAG: Zeta toxin family protein [Chloroflexi bacterium]|nr:Zeta toxin family protein [Chloroflexota bacterium]
MLAIGAFVNADTIDRGLSAFDSESVAMLAGRIMLQRLDELATQRADFAFETTLASRSFAPFLRGPRRSGYRVELVYVWLPSADLCVQRVHACRRSGGHVVDEEVVRRRYARGLQNLFSLYQSLADDWQVYEHAGGSEARRVAEGRGLHTDVVHDLQMWNLMRQQGRT